MTWTLDTPSARAALEIASEYADTALLNHSVRSYAFGARYAADHGLDHDEELFYVAALLHDLGLTAPFDSHTLPFEEASGHVARVLTAGLGWPADRRARAEEIIVLHMRDDVSAAEDVESHLLQVGTSADVSGLRVAEFAPSFTARLLGAHPRAGFGPVFTALVEDQARRKPDCAAASYVAGGAATRIAANPLDA
ncbi:HD domain-containing protein [Streptomyces sp. MMS21 TC-5]|uniref:HD domain-containing protein n=1 Tax=Streptomyces TaxID=1883 RepID=UPI0006ADF01F|nr:MULTISPECIES: HD domain-containing protein [unclassified Streptomyces]KOU94780.1 cyanamide hydratase [Streptomyces sp. XY593]MCI4082795.1 HD domain-containing protein [Streptomyces sp. MMS21 TC-5]QNE26234.1 HD domain-containing protein [Streptomyces sp. INR7]